MSMRNVMCWEKDRALRPRVVIGRMGLWFLILSLCQLASRLDAQEEQADDSKHKLDLITIDGEMAFALIGLDPTEVADIPETELSSAIKVFTLVEGRPGRQALFGEVRDLDSDLVFVPRFSLRPGKSYRVTTSELLGSMRRDFTIPDRNREPTTQVIGVYPSQERLPENLLKFYVQFSAPMSRGMVYEQARILNEHGDRVDLAFLEIEQELWDASGTRVTLLFDPGRIKRELRPRADIGTPLREGKDFVLEIDRAWKDENGNQLVESHRKSFTVSAHDEVCPDPANWKVRAPGAGTSNPLVLLFDEPLDRAMLEHAISPEDENGEPIDGKVRVDEQERRWIFEPSEAWSGNAIQLRILTALEDRAGNSIHKPFEIDLTKPFESKYPDEFFVLPITLPR